MPIGLTQARRPEKFQVRREFLPVATRRQ